MLRMIHQSETCYNILLCSLIPQAQAHSPCIHLLYCLVPRPRLTPLAFICYTASSPGPGSLPLHSFAIQPRPQAQAHSPCIHLLYRLIQPRPQAQAHSPCIHLHYLTVDLLLHTHTKLRFLYVSEFKLHSIKLSQEGEPGDEAR